MMRDSVELFNLKQRFEVMRTQIVTLSEKHKSEIEEVLSAGQEALEFNPDAMLYAIGVSGADMYSIQIKANAKFSKNRLRVFWAFDESFGFINLDSILTFVNRITFTRFLALEHLKYYVPEMHDVAKNQMPYVGTADPESKWTLPQVLEKLHAYHSSIIYGKPLLNLLKELDIR
ncbi:hypothetical protein [Ewingella americana]|uniref:Uncharacterized protein n=1 Tax=Ewingella americana TaxID=41202 RepID=A0A502GFE1_9GAMM|nr:hypothetical protein [Ewingella americana]TPG60000.1 hypothetical protein EAH77_15650 [Ewingella americana]